MPDAGTTTTAEFELIPVNFPMVQGAYAFPVTAKAPTDVSPAWSWTGVPADAKSLALVFEDVGIAAVKWVVWDIPPTVTMIPERVSDSATMLTEIAGASQLGSLGNIGYAGPARPNQRYEWTLFALKVERLPNTAGKSTVQLRQSIVMNELSRTETVIVFNR